MMRENSELFSFAHQEREPNPMMNTQLKQIQDEYPDYFDIYRHTDRKPIYSPIRITGQDCEFADRMNDGIMKFNNNQLDEICQRIMRNLYEL